jgi:putative NIF3 family GTP cyclohydrolase 1 type 2
MNKSFFISMVFLAVILSSKIGYSQGNRQTAYQIVEQIKHNLGVPWRQPTVDVFKTGDSSTVVTGIAVTMMATLDVLQRAVAHGENLIISHEPVYFYHFDPEVPMEKYKDPVYETKKAYINEHHLVVWRFHDYMHRRHPDAILTGMMHKLGWDAFQDHNEGNVFHVGPLPLKQLSQTIKNKLGIHAMRVIGNPDALVSTVAFSPGFGGFEGNRNLFQKKGVDVLMIGEAHEWETGEYATDAVTEGNKKGMIVLGHIPSEQAGMEECAGWLKTFIKDVKIEFVPAREPFWIPE